jgi:methylase of polypeptide subunit release factors
MTFPQELYQKHLVPGLLPKLGAFMGQRLKIGIEVLDIGCGTGHQLVQMAKHFPKCRFTGIDLCPDAIRQAQQQQLTGTEANGTGLN